MAITRGQMQRQLRRGGGIMNIAPREKFGIGSSLKKFVRKVIPNEVAKIATVAAPFVAPFNPQLAAAMAGIGSFDQTGSIGDSLKSAAITYGGGQLARYAGGAGFQKPGMGNFGLSGFSSPIGTSTGFGKLLSRPGTSVKSVGGVNYEDMSKFNELGLGGSGGAANIQGGIPTAVEASEVALTGNTFQPQKFTDLVNKQALEKIDPKIVSDAVSKTTADASKGVFELIKEGNYTDAAVEAGKKALKSVFLDKDGNLDKTALLAAGSFGLTYLDAKRLADAEGVDIGTEEEYDEATKAEKKEEYASYLTNFFGGKKDGGRIGYGEGGKSLDEQQMEIIKGGGPKIIGLLAEADELMGTEGDRLDMALKMLSRDNKDNELLKYMLDTAEERGKTKLGVLMDLIKSQRIQDIMAFDRGKKSVVDDISVKDLSRKEGSMKDGGRIGYMFGNKVEDDEGIMSMSEDKEDENTKMAYFPGDVFSKAEISKLFRDKSLTTNEDRKQLFRILMNPGMFPEAEEMLKKMLRGKQDGGRIGFNSGSSRPSQLFKLLEEAEAAGDMDKVKEIKSDLFREFGLKLAKGGRINYNMGSEVPIRKNKAGIEELDYRESGGFVPVGVKEKADDVPAMLSKNEFVLTADAVRGIGGGDVEKGAEKLYGVMKQAEKVGRA